MSNWQTSHFSSLTSLELLFIYLQTIFRCFSSKAIRTLWSSSRLQDDYCMDKLKHSTDLPSKTQISVKINLEDFSVPIEKGLKPSSCYIQGNIMGPIIKRVTSQRLQLVVSSYHKGISTHFHTNILQLLLQLKDQKLTLTLIKIEIFTEALPSLQQRLHRRLKHFMTSQTMIQVIQC